VLQIFTALKISFHVGDGGTSSSSNSNPLRYANWWAGG